MFRIHEPAWKLILFYWKNDEAYKYSCKTNCLLENLSSCVGDLIQSCQSVFGYQ